MRRPLTLVAVCGYSLLISLFEAASCWLALAAFGLPLPVTAAFIVLGLITLGGMVPTPASAGGFHALCQLGLLAFFTVDAPPQTVLPVVGLHAVLYIPAAIIGMFFVFACRPQIKSTGVP